MLDYNKKAVSLTRRDVHENMNKNTHISFSNTIIIVYSQNAHYYGK